VPSLPVNGLSDKRGKGERKEGRERRRRMGQGSSSGSDGAAGGPRKAEDRRSWSAVVGEGMQASARENSVRFEVTSSRPGTAPLSLVFSCVVQGFRKDQDRIALIPKLVESPTVLFGGIFDGHGKDGDLVAEEVAEALPMSLRDLLLKQEDLSQAGAIEGVIRKAFAAVQKVLDQQYEEEVVQPTMKLKEEIEQEQGTSLGEISLPLGSGTTATIFLVFERSLYVAYVGDSRAVLCRRGKGGKGLKFEELTHDQNVNSASPEELQRLEEAGGTIFGRHVSGDYVEGMLQLTRSLGDVPLHRQNIVISDPGFKEVAIEDDMLFAIGASDGLWDYFSSEEAMQFVYDSVKSTLAEDQSISPEDAFLRVCQELQSTAAARAEDTGKQADDTSVLIMTLTDWWKN